jgi:DNA-binding transcriptional ArsR family regulator
MDLGLVFRVLSDDTRRRIIDELAERDGQTLFEIHVRLISWHGASLSRQGLSKHLALMEQAGLIRTEWRWRSKHHFLERAPLRQVWDLWLGQHAGNTETKEMPHENRTDERAGQ